MHRKVFFMGGIHGVGKTTLSEKVADKLGVDYFSAGELIKSLKNDGSDQTSKLVENVKGNQEVLATAIEIYTRPESTFLLDGHFTLVNTDGEIVTIPMETYEQISPKAIVVLHDSVARITQRLRQRDSREYDKAFLSDFQTAELEYANEVANHLKIPLKKFNVNEELDILIEFIESF